MAQRVSLPTELTRRTEQALRRGALQPLVTRCRYVDEAGVRFVVRVLDSLQRKQEAAERQTGNPFLPYDPEMFVADVSPTHVGLLNKFNVLERHLLVVTRKFEDQRALLTLQDFEALWRCMVEIDGVAFYNAGVEAGASQPHKHLQVVPFPLAPKSAGVPIDDLLQSARFSGRVGTIDSLPFVHAVARVDSLAVKPPDEAALSTLDLYRDMLRLTSADTGPYNLLVTRRWMWLVPRSREHFESISVNALGYAGALLVRDESLLRLVETTGPMAILRSVGVAH